MAMEGARRNCELEKGHNGETSEIQIRSVDYNVHHIVVYNTDHYFFPGFNHFTMVIYNANIKGS